MLTALFYLKVTYFAGGLALAGLAVLISPHVRARLPAWAAIGALVVANALAPGTNPTSPTWCRPPPPVACKGNLRLPRQQLLRQREGYAPYIAGVAFAVWMWWRAGAAVPADRHRRHPRGRILGAVAEPSAARSPGRYRHCLLLYDQIRERFGPAAPALLVLMIFPLLAIAHRRSASPATTRVLHRRGSCKWSSARS